MNSICMAITTPHRKSCATNSERFICNSLYACHDAAHNPLSSSFFPSHLQHTPVMTSHEFVQCLREAAPYIHTFRGKTFVIGFGGEVVDQRRFASLSHDINLLVSLGVRIILVHGARPQVEAQLKFRGIARRFHQDYRLTDLASLEVVKQAIGYTRAEIEAQLSVAMPDSPMAGANLRVACGNFIIARPLGVIDGIDMQYSGQIRKLETAAIKARLDAGDLVLLSPLGYSPTGEIFNLRMEDVATQAAISLKADKLMFLVDSPSGVVDADGQRMKEFIVREAETWLQTEASHLSDEVRRSMNAAVLASRHGIKRAHLVAQSDGALLQELFTHDGSGTMIAPEALRVMRRADIDDVGSILGLIEPLERDGLLVKRGRELIEMEIGYYSVIEHDNKITGCVALYPFPESQMGELACLAVSQQWQSRGHGDALLRHTEQRARQLGLERLFVLTTQTAHWFVERGFVEAELSELPLRKQELYNYQRRSKAFVKML